MSKNIILAAVTLLMLPLVAAAQMRLSVEEAVALALSENPTIKVAELEVVRYDYVRKTTVGSLLPQLSVGGDYMRTFKNQNLSEGFTLGNNQYNTFTAEASISLALYLPAVYRTMRMNQMEAEAAVESARASRIDLIAAVKQCFYTILLTEQSLEVMQSSYNTAQETVRETQTKYEHGLSSEYDLLTAQVQMSNIEPTMIQLKSSIQNAKDMLKMYLSIPADVDVEAVGELSRIKDVVLDSFNTISRDITENSTLRSLDIQSNVLVQSQKVSNASRLPSLSAWGSYTYTGSNMGSFDFTTMNVASSSYFWQQPAYAGVTLSVPLFSGLTNTNRSRQITNQIEQLRLQRIYAETGVRLELNTAISDLLTAREQMFSQEVVVEQATKAYAISDTRYKAGAGTILELNSARLSLTQAELNLSQAIYDMLVARSEYDKIIGKEK